MVKFKVKSEGQTSRSTSNETWTWCFTFIFDFELDCYFAGNWRLNLCTINIIPVCVCVYDYARRWFGPLNPVRQIKLKLNEVYSKIRLNEVVKTEVEPPKFGLNYYLTTIPEGWSNPNKPIFTARASFWQLHSLRYKLTETKISKRGILEPWKVHRSFKDASDRRSSKNSLTSEDPCLKFFRIDAITGELCLISPLDREESDKININIIGKLIWSNSKVVISPGNVPFHVLIVSNPWKSWHSESVLKPWNSQFYLVC